MADGTKIEWSNVTVNTVSGCSSLSDAGMSRSLSQRIVVSVHRDDTKGGPAPRVFLHRYASEREFVAAANFFPFAGAVKPAECGRFQLSIRHD